MRHIWTHPATISTAIIFGLAAILIFAYAILKLGGIITYILLADITTKRPTIATYKDSIGNTYYIARVQSFVKADQCFYEINRNIRFTPFAQRVSREFYYCNEEEKNQFVSGRPNSDGTRAPFLFEYNHITHESKVTPITK